jgi:hypothetical protein
MILTEGTNGKLMRDAHGIWVGTVWHKWFAMGFPGQELEGSLSLFLAVIRVMTSRHRRRRRRCLVVRAAFQESGSQGDALVRHLDIITSSPLCLCHIIANKKLKIETVVRVKFRCEFCL